MLYPKTGPHWFEDEKLHDSQILELAGKVKASGTMISPLEAFSMFHAGTYPEAGVEITLKDGRQLNERLPFPKGHPKNRMTRSEFEDRFRLAASYTLEPTRIEKAIGMIVDLENV